MPRDPESWTSQTDKVQSTIIDDYLVRGLSITEAFVILSDLCGKKSGRSFSVIVKFPTTEYKQPLVTLNCRSMTVRDIIKLIAEQSNVFIEFTSLALEIDYSRNSQGEKRK